MTSLTKNAQQCQSGIRRILIEDILNYHFLQKNLCRTLLYAYTKISPISPRLVRGLLVLSNLVKFASRSEVLFSRYEHVKLSHSTKSKFEASTYDIGHIPTIMNSLLFFFKLFNQFSPQQSHVTRMRLHK